MDDMELLTWLVDVVVKTAALLIGGTWALYKIKEHRGFKNLIQLDLDVDIGELVEPEEASAMTWNDKGGPVRLDRRPCGHAVEVLLRFTNKGRTRARLFNVQIGINTMRAPGQAQFDEVDGHLHLKRIHTSGNLVPLMPVSGRPLEETSFYYIEPGVQQTISYLCLVSEPRELLQVSAMFSLEQRRLFPEKLRGPQGLYPHSVARTYQLPPDSRMGQGATA